MDTKIINLIGGPGHGKSTAAFKLSGRMKELGVNMELAYEAAKEHCWERREGALACQPFVFGDQLFRIERLLGKVDFVITDSPILLSAIYGSPNDLLWRSFVIDKYIRMTGNITYLVNRNPEKSYQNAGRNQNQNRAVEIHRLVRLVMDDNKIPYKETTSDDPAIEKILRDLGLTSEAEGV